jgi:hypothetical protein
MSDFDLRLDQLREFAYQQSTLALSYDDYVTEILFKCWCLGIKKHNGKKYFNMHPDARNEEKKK